MVPLDEVDPNCMFKLSPTFSSCFRLSKFIWSFSHRLAMTFGHCSMVLRLNLGSSHGCGLESRSLDLLVLLNHNYNIVTLIYKIAVKKLKKISLIMGFQDLCAWVSVENVIPDNFRVLNFSWNGPERSLFACFMFCHRMYLPVLPQSCGNFKWS